MMESGGSIEFPECAPIPSSMTPSPALPLQGKGDGHRTGRCVGTPSPQGEGWGEVGPCGGTTLSSRRGVGGEVQKTPITHTIAIPANVVDENLVGKIFGAFGENNTCYGYTLLTGQNDALTLFGDDATTLEQDGFLENGRMVFKIWDEQGSEERNIEVVFDNSLPQNDGVFVDDGISIIQKLKITANNIEGDDILQIRVFPNPAKEFLNIQIQGAKMESCEVVILDMQGREIKNLQIADGNLRLNISEVKRGMYVLKIFRIGKVYTEKLIID